MEHVTPFNPPNRSLVETVVFTAILAPLPSEIFFYASTTTEYINLKLHLAYVLR